jgi:hypothetical protein
MTHQWIAFSTSLLHQDPQGLKEKVAAGRMRGKQRQHSPLTLTLSLMERGLE